MKRLYALGALVLAMVFTGALARAQDDQYIGIYTLIQEAENLEDRNENAQAMARYQEAQAALQSFQKGNPSWNTEIVKFRLSYLENRIAGLREKGVSAAPGRPTPTRTSEPSPAPSPSATPTPAAPPAQPAAPATDWQAEAQSLKDQIQRLQSDNSVMQAKLREALAAVPAQADPREIERLENEVKSLQKAKELLTASLEKEKGLPGLQPDTNLVAELQAKLRDTTQQLSEQKEAAARLTRENDDMQTRVREFSQVDLAALRAENEVLKRQLAEPKPAPAANTGEADALRNDLTQARNQLAALQSERDLLRAERAALENRLAQAQATPPAPEPAAKPERAEIKRIKQLESQNEDLRDKLADANKALAAARTKKSAARLRDLEQQLTGMRARVEVLEAKPIPYTPQELALFRAPEPKIGPVVPASTFTAETTSTPAVASAAAAVPSAAPAPPARAARTVTPETAALVAEAHRYFSTRQLDKAESTFQKVVAQDPGNSAAMLDLAIVQMQQPNRLEEAERNVKRALELDPDSAYGLATLGQLRFRQKRLDDAFDTLSRAAQIDPKNAEIQNLLGLVLNQKGLRGPAETALRKALILDPGNADAHYNLAVIYAAQNPPAVELARWHYQRALSGGGARNEDLEKFFDQRKGAEPSPGNP